jgi:hypothetical protein
MKRLHIAAILLLCALPVLAQTQASTATRKTATKKTQKKKKAAPSSQTAGVMTIPKGAVLDQKDGNYHYTDKSGKKWVYMMTPMGSSRWEDKGPAAAAAPPPQHPSSNRFSADPNLKAVDQGETVKFVRSTPFGAQSWTKKKSELTDDERTMLAGSSSEVNSGSKTQN